MDLGRLRYFYAVAKLGSFTSAANEIHVSQPSLSKMVKQLEEEIGAPLFKRGKKGVVLTPEGRLTFDKCQLIFGEIDALKIGLSQIQKEVTGDLAIGASDNLCNYVLPKVFDELIRRFPKVRTKLLSGTSSEIQTELLSGKIEFGFFYTKVLRDREFEVKPIRFIEFAIVASREMKIKDLQLAPYIGSRKTDYKGSYPALEMLESVGAVPKTIFETNNQETQKKMAILGSGYTVVPIHMVESEIASGALYRVATNKKIGSMVSLVKKRNKSQSRPGEVFEQILNFKIGDGSNSVFQSIL